MLDRRSHLQRQVIEPIDQLVELTHPAPIEVKAQARPQDAVAIAALPLADAAFIHQFVEFAVEDGQGVGADRAVQQQFHAVFRELGGVKHPVEVADVLHGLGGAAGLLEQAGVLRGDEAAAG